MARTLADLLPDPADRLFVQGVYQDLGQEWAAETLGYMLTYPEVELRDKFNGTATDLGREWAAEILGGMLDGSIVEWERAEMGFVNRRPELEGIKRARCTCGGLVDRHGNCSLCKRFCGVPEYEQALNPRQMVLGQKTQLKMEV